MHVLELSSIHWHEAIEEQFGATFRVMPEGSSLWVAQFDGPFHHRLFESSLFRSWGLLFDCKVDGQKVDIHPLPLSTRTICCSARGKTTLGVM